jgi:uncharacterized protein
LASSTATRPSAPRPFLALIFGVTIGVLGGLIGLGGAEFRLPILIAFFAIAVHQAVRLNLLISLITLLAAAIARFGFAAFPDLPANGEVILTLALGATAAAWAGANLLQRVGAGPLLRIIAALLFGIALLLGFEIWAGEAFVLLRIDGAAARPIAAIAIGIGIGLVSSLLGVAGGELIIPTLTYVFGFDIRSAGTASLLISIPAVTVGVIRHFRNGAYGDRAAITALVAPMGAGSVIGAMLGALMLPHIDGTTIKALLAIILVVSAVKLARKSH